MVSYWEALSLWLSGEKLDGLTMWGEPIIFWGRLGKLLQFSGGLVVVLDLIGPDRFEQAARRVKKPVVRLRYLFRRHGFSLENIFLLTLGFVVYIAILLGIPLLASWMVLKAVLPKPKDGLLLTESTWIAWKFLLYASGLQLVVVISLYFGHLFLLAVGWVVGLGKRNQAAKWFSVLLVVVGFHFDLLAS